MTTSRRPTREPESLVEHALPGSLIGRIHALNALGAPEVEVPGHGVHRARVLRSVDRAWLRGDDAVGREVLIVCVGGDPTCPVIVGLLEDPVESLLALSSDAASRQIDVSVDGRIVTLEATHEITLRCGEASLTLHADGRVVTRGVNIVSQASEQQRIQGAVVKIN
ncbi:MAG: DUF6484 domain-containing protein [Polyangiales bacterium]